ncbi:hypothetical protein BDZ89DRAFT_1133712 [Hymenopellis radicata]|nr:hypothetical protein BDZ89DRAFT_1133712 [Hymenopellis radicata]
MSQHVKSTKLLFPALRNVPEDSPLQCLHETEMNLRSLPIPEKEAAWAKLYYVEFCDALAHGPDKVLTFLERIMPRFNQEFKRPQPFDPADLVGLMEWRAYEILYVRHVVHRTCHSMYVREIQAGIADGTELSSVDSTPTRNKPVSRNTRNAARNARAVKKNASKTSDDGFDSDDVPRLTTPEYEKIIFDLGLSASMLCDETHDLVAKSTLWKDTVTSELGLSHGSPTQTPTPRRSPRGHLRNKTPVPPTIDLNAKIPVLTAKAAAARLTDRMAILQQASSSRKRVAAGPREDDGQASKKRRIAPPIRVSLPIPSPQMSTFSDSYDIDRLLYPEEQGCDSCEYAASSQLPLYCDGNWRLSLRYASVKTQTDSTAEGNESDSHNGPPPLEEVSDSDAGDSDVDASEITGERYQENNKVGSSSGREKTSYDPSCQWSTSEEVQPVPRQRESQSSRL